MKPLQFVYFSARRLGLLGPLLKSHFQLSRANISTMREERLNIDGSIINYLRIGEGSHVVMCLPGALGTIWSDFKPQIEGFDKGKFSLVVWDPPGYGKSRPPNKIFTKYFYETDAQMALALMDRLGVEKYSLLGWSDGGISALIMAADSSKINKLVIWGANAYITETDMKLYEGIRDVSKWSPKMREPLAATYGERNLQDMMTSWYSSINEIYKSGGNICKSVLAKIVTPTLIIHGDQDPLVPQEHPRYLAKHIPSAKLHTFEKGKHNVHLRYSKEFNNVVQSFLLNASY